jgi:hypothetical protein
MHHKDNLKWLYLNVGSVVKKKNVLNTLSVAPGPNSILVLSVKKRFKKRVDNTDIYSRIEVLSLTYFLENGMRNKMTIAYFKEAIKQDGNVHYGVSALLYVLRQIEYAHADGQITDKQKDKLWHWAYDKYAE